MRLSSSPASVSLLSAGLLFLGSGCGSPPSSDVPDARDDGGADTSTSDTGSRPDTGFDAALLDAPDAAVDVPVVVDSGPVCLSGLGSADAGTDAATNDASGADGGLLNNTYVYVMDTLAVDNLSSTSRYGFNLDTFASTTNGTTGCGRADTFARFDRDQNVPTGCSTFDTGCQGGVDNQLPVLLDRFSTTLNVNATAQFQAQVPYHRIVLLIRLTGVDSFVNDPSVTLQAYEGYATYSTDCTSVLPNREYQVTLSSLTPGGTTLDDAKFSVQGSITNGRLSIQAPPQTVFDLPLRGLIFPLTIRVHELRMRFNPASWGGSSGNLGGLVYGEEFYQSVPMVYRPVVDDLILDSIDLPVSGVCSDLGPPPHFGAMGLGLGFSLVSARIATGCAITNQQSAGVCGTMGNP